MTFTDRLLAGLGPAIIARGGPLIVELVRGLADPLDRTDTAVSPVTTGYHPQLFDLDTTPDPGFLGAVVGTSVPRALTLDEQREFVRDRPSMRRGTVRAIKAAVRTLLTGTRRVDLIERDGSPWRFSVRVWRGEAGTATVAQMRALAESQKPVGIVIANVSIDTPTDDHFLREHGPTWPQVLAAYPTQASRDNHVPELPIRGRSYASLSAQHATYAGLTGGYSRYQHMRDDTTGT